MTDWVYWLLKRIYFLFFLNARSNEPPLPEPFVDPVEELPVCPESTKMPIDMTGIESDEEQWEKVQ